jgi:hypothetical protein
MMVKVFHSFVSIEGNLFTHLLKLIAMNSFIFPSITKYLLLTLFILFNSNSFGQSNHFITEVPIHEQSKNDSLIKYQQTIRRHGLVKRLSYVKIGLLSKAQNDGYLELHIPGIAGSIVTKAKNVKYISDQDYEWIGKCDEDRGTIILICHKGVFQAHISTPDGIYEILPAPGGLYSLREIDGFRASDVGCSVTPSHSGLREAMGTRGLDEQERGHI